MKGVNSLNGVYSGITSGDPNRISHKRARIFAKAVDDLEKKIGHGVEAEDIVKEAHANKKSVFWLYIPNDKDKALRHVQLEAARHILSTVRAKFVDYKGREVTTRVRESIVQEKGLARVYVKHEVVRDTKPFLVKHLECLVEEQENLFSRMRTYKQLGAKNLEAIEDAIDGMKKNIGCIGKN